MPYLHTVTQGEYVSSIAKQYGFADSSVVYDHSENAALKQKRPDPNVLLPGDVLYIPDKDVRQESCSTGQCHKFRVKNPKNLLNVVLKDSEGTALSNQAYVLKVPGKNFHGTTDASGLLSQEIPLGGQVGVLTLKDMGLTWSLNIGHLDPVHDEGSQHAILSGVQARLNNLGFACGNVDGQLGPKTKSAIRTYQIVRMGIDPSAATGEPDGNVQSALQQEHGC